MKALYVWPTTSGQIDHLTPELLAKWRRVFDTLFLSTDIGFLLRNEQSAYLSKPLAAAKAAGFNAWCWLTGAYDRADSCLGRPFSRQSLVAYILRLATEPINGLLLEEPHINDCHCEHCESNYARDEASERGYYREAVAKQLMWLLKDSWAGVTNKPIGITLAMGAKASNDYDMTGCPWVYWARNGMVTMVAPEIYQSTAAKFKGDLTKLTSHWGLDPYWHFPRTCRVVPTITAQAKPTLIKGQWDAAMAKANNAAVWVDRYLTDETLTLLFT
jgi:hypothetical protein